MNISSDTLDVRLDDVPVVDNVSWDVHGLGSGLSLVLNGSCDWVSDDHLILELVVLRLELFDGSVDCRLNDNSLSGGFDHLLSDDSGLSSDPLSDDLGFGGDSLSDDSGFDLNSLFAHLCVL